MTEATKRPHIFLAVLGWKLAPYHAQSRERLVLRCVEEGIALTIRPEMGAGIDRGRNISIATMRRSAPDCTHFLFIDSDLAFDPDDIFDMMRTGLDVVGGAYPKKRIDWEAVVDAVHGGVDTRELPKHAGDFVVNAQVGKLRAMVDGKGHRYAEVEELGTGFLLLRREAIERYIEHYRTEIAYTTDYDPKEVEHHMVFAAQRDPGCELELAKQALLAAAERDDVLDDHVGRYRCAIEAGLKANGRYLSEDYAFCRKWRMMGGKVHCAVDVKLVHQGPMLFEGHLGTTLTDGKAPPKGKPELLTVYECEHPKLRLGRDHDGGYVLCKAPVEYDFFLSAGINNENSFERAALDAYPYLVCEAFDFRHCPGEAHPRYHFSQAPVPQMGPSGRNALVKLDIEGDEYPWLLGSDLSRVAQAVIELHSPFNWDAIARLHETHVCVHAHGTNWSGFFEVTGADGVVKMPTTLETAWMRRDLTGPIRPSRAPIPGPLDRPNRQGRPDMVIDWPPFVNKGEP